VYISPSSSSFFFYLLEYYYIRGFLNLSPKASFPWLSDGRESDWPYPGTPPHTAQRWSIPVTTLLLYIAIFHWDLNVFFFFLSYQLCMEREKERGENW
jgi:hypothetical protein